MTDSGLLLLPLGDTHTGSAHDDVEVHSEDSDSGVVLDSEINVLLDSESKVSGLTVTRKGWTRCQGREETRSVPGRGPLQAGAQVRRFDWRGVIPLRRFLSWSWSLSM